MLFGGLWGLANTLLWESSVLSVLSYMTRFTYLYRAQYRHILYIQTTLSLPTHQLMYVNCFNFLVILNSATMNNGIQVALQHIHFISFGYVDGICVSGSCGGSVFKF